MVYDPATDFLGLWRKSGGSVSKMEMPGLDYVLSALARAGIITLSVSATAPVVNQSTTAWLQAAVASWSAEGAFFLWDETTTAYLPATPALFLQFLQATAGQNGSSVYATVGGPPLNTVGLNGDFAIRTDEPGGVYGPKAAGAWPATPVPGTVNEVSSQALDNTFGADPGAMIFRGPLAWQALPIGTEGDLLGAFGGAPTWAALSALFDTLFGGVQGSVLYRDALSWAALEPGVASQVLASGGPGANPSWSPRTAEFDSGTTMVFQQSAAPTGWTKLVDVNDYALRVVSGDVGLVTGTPFSTVFAQTEVGDTALTIAQMPSHDHGTERYNGQIPQSGSGASGGLVNTGTTDTDATGGGEAHTHTVALALSYIDVILARKD
jgi:hypothetical protein